MNNQEVKQIAKHEVAGMIESWLTDEQGMSNLKEIYSLSEHDTKALQAEFQRMMESLRKGQFHHE